MKQVFINLPVKDAEKSMNFYELDGFISSDGEQRAIEISPTLLIDYKILGNGLTPSDLLRQ